MNYLHDDCLWAVDTSTYNTYDFLHDGETIEQLLERANISKQNTIERYMDIICDFSGEQDTLTYFKSCLEKTQKIKYEIMTWKEFKEREREYLLDNTLKEITEEKYYEMLNVLPPIYDVVIDGVEMFCMCEMHTGTYTTQYAKYNGKYYSKMVDVTDRTTWIHNSLRGNENV